MSETQTRPLTIVCLASYFKGGEFIRECKRQGARVILVTKEKILHEDWPRESLDDIIALPNDAGPELFIHVVSQIGRPQKIDRVIALEEFDVITAGLIREHLCMEGMTSTEARVFRDKLSMRVRASKADIPVPDFIHVLNYDGLRDYMTRVPAPWVMKPRSDVSAIGIKKLDDSEQVWRAIDALDARENIRERSPYYLLERYVAGDVFHVDSLVQDSKVVFAGASAYGRPPMDVTHQGGVFISRTVQHGSDDEKRLLKLNRKLIAALGLPHGATHAEFIKSSEDGEFYFLEIAARVGGAYIAESLEAASGINIWQEWARIEMTRDDGSYKLPTPRKDYGGIVLSLARQEYPETAAYTDEEIVYRVRKRYHVGLVVKSQNLERVEGLTNSYARRFTEDFTAIVPPPERPE
jgi:ATP-grasp domain